MINYITTENAFNKVLKRGMKYAENVVILFTSPYDSVSRDILDQVERGNHKLRSKLHVVDSFETPHAFVACKTTKVPCLVNINDKKKDIEYYLPFIYEKLGVSLP